MNIQTHIFRAAQKTLEEAKRLVIMSHRHPDADTLGSNLALRLHLESQGKEVISACVDTPPPSASFLPKIDKFVQDFSYDTNTTFIAVDCGAAYMTRFNEIKPEIFSGRFSFVNIDHHASNEGFGTVNVVDPDAASATQIIYRLFKIAGWPINRQIATCLLHGLYFDTGSFKHSNTTKEVMEVAADLMRLGGDFKTIAKNEFNTNPMPKLRLWGRVFDRLNVNEKRVITSAITNEDFTQCEATNDDLTGAIDYLNAVPDTKFSLLLSEDNKGNVKGSLRTQGNVDLSEVAGIFGGGGHKKASGFALPGKLRLAKGKIEIEGS